MLEKLKNIVMAGNQNQTFCLVDEGSPTLSYSGDMN